MKEKGILLPVFSLPSKYGIGDFGYEAYEFVNILSINNIKYWEILPINKCKNSPYSPISYYALDENYISLDVLLQKSLIKNVEYRNSSNKVTYDDFKEKYFKEAFKNFEKTSEYYEFIKCKDIVSYAEFMDKKNADYYLFLQYEAYCEWSDLKKYANSKGVKIIGDMPVYPIFNSVDTKYYPRYFEMKRGKFTFESGTPPDFFNEEGQKWNSPVYNIENIKKDKYKYLIERFEYQHKLFDILRIDYFRGYDSFFRIPIGKSGKEGEYVDGVGSEFFEKLFKESSVKREDIIVEDLGDIREETKDLINNFGFTRQKILQYTIDLHDLYDKDNEDDNVLVFPGNHDCNTIYGWYKTLEDFEKNNLKEFLKKNSCYEINVNIGLMQYLLRCKGRIAIIMAQDVIGLDEKSRINVPGTVSDSNWSWKLIDFNDFKEQLKYFNI